MREIHPGNVFRCTYRDERISIPRDRCVLIVEDALCDDDAGYGAYLLMARDVELIDAERTYYSDIQYEAGLFLCLYHALDGDVILPLHTSDSPDRTLFVTGRCNSNCIMCPYGTKQRAISEDTSLSLLLRYVSLMDPYADYLCITGGEPTLLKAEFLELLRAVDEHFEDCVVHILTNGRAFYYKDFFDAYRQCRSNKTLLGIPLHASFADLHDEISRESESFCQTVLGLDRLYGASEHIELRIVTTALNMGDLPKLAGWIAKRYPNVYRVSIMGLEMMGNAMINRSRVWVSFDDLQEHVETASEILLSAGVPVQLYNFPLCKISERYQSLCKKSISPDKVRFFPMCDTCGRKSACGGFFQTTIHMPDIAVAPY